MKTLLFAGCVVFAFGGLSAQTPAWQPSPGHTEVPIWPGEPPDAQPVAGPEESHWWPTAPTGPPGGFTVDHVSRPTITVYSPEGRNTGAAMVVFPGGGYQDLAIDLEGTEVCDWLTSEGITCVLLKYRVPSLPYDWHCNCRPNDLAISTQPLEDAQRTMRLARFHAADWHIDPHKIGVLGFSAGGYLVAEISTLFGRRFYGPVDAADKESCRPDFAVALYPGHLWVDDGQFGLNPDIRVTSQTPATFLLQATDDPVDGVENSLSYYLALKKAKVPVEIHLYAQGGHAFGLRRTKFPVAGWPALVETWLKTIGTVSK